MRVANLPAPSTQHYSAPLADASPQPFWLDVPDAPEPRSPLSGDVDIDLVIVGAGLTGLWAALQSLEENLNRSVMVLEGNRIASGASGRNGGFCQASLTHGIANGLARWPGEMKRLERMGRENLAAIAETIRRHEIACEFEESGAFSVATEDYQIPDLTEEAGSLRRYGWKCGLLDADQMKAQVHSPAYRGGVWDRDGGALVQPARLCWGLARAAEESGAIIHENSPVVSLASEGESVLARTPHGSVRARKCFLATSAFPPLARAVRRYIVPVYDYVLVTEPLHDGRRESLGWHGRQGISDMGNQFHYYRLTADNRILWGGYDAVYHFGNDMGAHREQRPQTFELLASQFFDTFPQMEGVRFTHRWGGAIDTCSRFAVMFGTEMDGRLAYAAGFTGLGVGASRFGARAALDLLDGQDTERTRLDMVRRKPIPFPPEPMRYLGIELTRRALARADRNQGRRGLWLRILDRLGMGFDS